MIISRTFNVFVLSAAISLMGAGTGFAQSLSDAAMPSRSDWGSGYMGLGGNLGQAIQHRRPPKTVRQAKVIPAQARVTRRKNVAQEASYNPMSDTPMFLIAQTLDNTRLNIANLRVRTRGP